MLRPMPAVAHPTLLLNVLPAAAAHSVLIGSFWDSLLGPSLTMAQPQRAELTCQLHAADATEATLCR